MTINNDFFLLLFRKSVHQNSSLSIKKFTHLNELTLIDKRDKSKYSLSSYN